MGVVVKPTTKNEDKHMQTKINACAWMSTRYMGVPEIIRAGRPAHANRGIKPLLQLCARERVVGVEVFGAGVFLRLLVGMVTRAHEGAALHHAKADAQAERF